MEEQSPDCAAEVYERACKIHLPRKPSIHFSWASYEETRGKVRYVKIKDLSEPLKY